MFTLPEIMNHFMWVLESLGESQRVDFYQIDKSAEMLEGL